tara:strand:+ start:84 stop:917 length:834 start_codon:yes stop_codon:yes gene_type:complete
MLLNKKGNAANKEEVANHKKVIFGRKQEEFNSVFAELHKKKREERKSRLCLGIWGEPKTGKTGIALDFPDRNIYVLDWDKGVESTWFECHNADERIQPYCPIVMNKDNIVDINKSEENSLLFINYVRDKIQSGEKPIFVFDGVDSWLDNCMLKVNPNPRVVTKMMPWQYGSRNKTFDFLMEAVYQLDCDVIYITHEIEKYEDNSPVGMIPNWRNWGGKFEQEIRCSKKKIKGETHFLAELIGSRTNGNLVGKVWTIREGTPPKIVWNGVPELREVGI